MHVLITGGAGFIGSHICTQLLKKGHSVDVIDNLSTGQIEFVPDGARLFEIDITNSQELEEIFDESAPDAVIHTAAQIDVSKSVSDPLYDANVNTIASLKLLELSRRHAVQKFVFSSTAAVYGDTSVFPTKEDILGIPLSPYGIGKLAVEQYMRFYGDVHGLPYTILRYANVYGPRQGTKGEAGVVAIFLQKLLSGEAPIIFGDGTQTRDFVFVEDVAHANVCAVESKEKKELYNVSTQKETSVNELYATLLAALKTQKEACLGKPRDGEIAKSVLSNQKMKQDWNWTPKTNLTSGIRKTVQWFRAKRSS
jgi:UDP-glucose 4-epimerase